jgi:hypothetical protein
MKSPSRCCRNGIEVHSETGPRAFPSFSDLISSIKTCLRVNDENYKPLIWNAIAEPIVTTAKRGRVAPHVPLAECSFHSFSNPEVPRQAL